MKQFRLTLGIKTFIAYLVISLGVAWYLAGPLTKQLLTDVDKVTEEVMRDTARILAKSVSNSIKNDEYDFKNIYLALFKYETLNVNKQTDNIDKKVIDGLDVYITDKKGVVGYDSTNLYVGQDFSKDNDVYETLRGEYGARVSNYDRHNKESGKAMYVAQAIWHNGEIFGVLTVVKKYSRLGQVVATLKQTSRDGATFVFIASIIFGLGVSIFVSRSTNKLINYTTKLSKGKNISPPKINQIEFKELAESIEELKSALESKNKLEKHVEKLKSELESKENVEEYVSIMAHELKSPIAAIHTTAQNLSNPMSDENKKSFIEDILSENMKMNQLINRLLELSRLEVQPELRDPKLINIRKLIESVVESQIDCKNKDITFEYNFNPNLSIRAEELLVNLAIRNIVQNAVDFTLPEGGLITFEGSESDGFIKIQIWNSGEVSTHIKDRLFKKGFVSSSRPHSKEKGNGLGLRFVKAIMDLHNGDVSLENRTLEYSHGVVATLKFPVAN